MYLDQILLAVGTALTLAGVALAVFLLHTRTRSRGYRRVLAGETKRLDVMSTLRETHSERERTVDGSGGLRSRDTEKLENHDADEDAWKTLKTSEPSLEAGEDAWRTLKTSELDASAEAGDSDREDIEDKTPSRTGQENGPGSELDLSPLQGKYEFLKEIHGGGMSRIFLARNVKLGNEWIVKYIDDRHATLADEADVLKKLNHISLPQIVDVFQTREGTFLVERYIEGATLQEVIELGQEIQESQICDWGQQLAQVLNYLHNLETPIIHCDLKPSNIMVTHDDRLVLIDFGISKQEGMDDDPSGITYRYAAPEQFGKGRKAAELSKIRFGSLPESSANWRIDQRTDLFSAGVILYELAAGDIPRPGVKDELSNRLSSELAAVIRKCISIAPAGRYQTAQELASALESMRSQRMKMSRSLLMRRVASAVMGISFAAGLTISASALYVRNQENLSTVSMDPGHAVVSAQQSVQVLIQKIRPSGKAIDLSPDQLRWSYSEDNIARLDGDRLVGINPGETTLYGQYRNKFIELQITVTEPMPEQTAVALRYPVGTEVSVYAGTGEREQIDGLPANCAFVSPEDISAIEGSLSVTDAGTIRFLEDGEVFTLPLEPAFLTADRVRCTEDEVYVLTGPWEDEDGSSYGIIRIGAEGAEFLYCTDAVWTMISDFQIASDGMIWFIQENLGTGSTTLNTLDPETGEPDWVMDLPDSSCAMVFDRADNLYIAIRDDGLILRVGAGEKEWTYFAGVSGERHFVDGAIANFYRPVSLAVEGNCLYVLDFDTVRRVTIEGSGALFTETVAGEPTPDTNPEVKLGKGCDTVFPASERATICVDGEGRLLLSDPKNSVIYEIKEER